MSRTEFQEPKQIDMLCVKHFQLQILYLQHKFLAFPSSLTLQRTRFFQGAKHFQRNMDPDNDNRPYCLIKLI